MDSFQFSVDWRWQRAKRLNDAQVSPSRSKDDKWVLKAYKFLKKKKTNTIQAEIRLERLFPAIFIAEKLRVGDVSQFRWLIEAAVLAAVESSDIADYLGTTEAVIEAYEMLFFDIRGKLDNEGYVVGAVLGPALTKGVYGNDPDGFWKVVAYFGGWPHVQGCWRTGQATPAAIDHYNAATKHRTALNAYAGSLALQPNAFNAVDVVQTGLEQIRHEEEQGRGGQGEYANAAVAALVNSMHIVVHKAGTKLPAVEEPLQLNLPAASAVFGPPTKDGKSDDK